MEIATRITFPGLSTSTERSEARIITRRSTVERARDMAFRRMILSIPPGKVSTSAPSPPQPAILDTIVRRTPVTHRSIAQLPWHRVVGVGGEIKLRGAAAHEQRARLNLEGVQFSGNE